ERVEGRQSPLARKHGCAGYDCGSQVGRHVLRFDRERERLVRALCEAGQPVEQGDAFLDVDRTPWTAEIQSRPELHHDRVDNRVPVQNIEYAIKFVLTFG